MKLIVSKFPTTCGNCKSKIAAGSQIYWQKGSKPLCMNCKSQGAESTASQVGNTQPASSKAAKYFPDFTIDWPELKPIILAACTNAEKGTKGKWNSSRAWTSFMNEYSGGSFAGFTHGQVSRWITHGYETDAIKGLQGLPPIREKRRTLYVEDGDMVEIDRVFAGEDNFMSTATKRQVIPGIKLNIELDASAASSKMLFHYQRWIAQTIYALESSGVDCEVNIFTLSKNLYREQGYRTARQVVRVKKEGEIADFAGFSLMFSPAAFRGVMFSLFAMHADRQGLSRIGYGSGVTSEWGVRWNSAEQSIDVACAWTAKEFPEGQMTSALKKAIEAMRTDVS